MRLTLSCTIHVRIVASQARKPRNIVLLSDGTGNSSAKLMKTNVWRMYEAVDLTKGDQLALYDNGVGTSSFKPLAILGGALGWGLKRNVRTLTPSFTGQMFVFVNDALLPGPWLRSLYKNNRGTAQLTVQAIGPDPVAQPPG